MFILLCTYKIAFCSAFLHYSGGGTPKDIGEFFENGIFYSAFIVFHAALGKPGSANWLFRIDISRLPESSYR